MTALMTEPVTEQVAEMPVSDLVQVDLGWWKLAGYDLVQVVSPRTALGTAWIVWHGDHVLHTTDTLPRAGGWVASHLTGGKAR